MVGAAIGVEVPDAVARPAPSQLAEADLLVGALPVAGGEVRQSRRLPLQRMAITDTASVVSSPPFARAAKREAALALGARNWEGESCR